MFIKVKNIILKSIFLILFVSVLITSYILSINIPYWEPDYDYRLVAFGNNGSYPQDLIDFASSLSDQYITIEQANLRFEVDGCTVLAVALDDNTFYKTYPEARTLDHPYVVLSSFYSIGDHDIKNKNVYINGTEVDIIAINNTEIPFGATSNIHIPNNIGPVMFLVTSQTMLNELYCLYPPQHQRLISIYYKTNDGNSITTQMKHYSSKSNAHVQIWDYQDFTINSSHKVRTNIKRALILCFIIIYTIIAEYILILTSYKCKKLLNLQNLDSY